MDSRPIGVFDSGLGGLTAVSEIIKLLPNEDIVYLGDTARVPYGTRSKETIARFALEDTDFLLKNDVKCIVVACNTVSSVAISEVKKHSPVPVFGVIKPAAKKTVSKSTNKRVGVIGTRATIASKAYEKAIKRMDKKFKVFSKSAPLLVPFIEEGNIKGKIIEDVCKLYLDSFKKNKIDSLIMGCTHYPIIEGIIAKIVGDKVALINPGKEVAYDVKDYLTDNKLINGKKSIGVRKYFVTDLTDRFIKVAEMFLGGKIKGRIEKVNL